MDEDSQEPEAIRRTLLRELDVSWELGPDATDGPLTYDRIAERATEDAGFREGLLAAAKVCRAQGIDRTKPPCPSGIAAVYIERLAEGEMP